VVAGTDGSGRHAAEFATPAGFRYYSTAPPLRGAPEIYLRSDLESSIRVALTHWHAA
jgi:hypothetical protein